MFRLVKKCPAGKFTTNHKTMPQDIILS